MNVGADRQKLMEIDGNSLPDPAQIVHFLGKPDVFCLPAALSRVVQGSLGRQLGCHNAVQVMGCSFIK